MEHVERGFGSESNDVLAHLGASLTYANGHMAQGTYDSPVDLSSSKLVAGNGLCKEEMLYDRDRHIGYGSALTQNQLQSAVTVGIPDQSHGKYMYRYM